MIEISERDVDHVTAVPASAWVFAWSFVAGQLLELVRRGAQSPDGWPLSMLFGVALVTFFSHGVLRARGVRFWLVAALVGALGGVLGAEQSIAPTQKMYEDPFSDPFVDPADPFVGFE